MARKKLKRSIKIRRGGLYYCAARGGSGMVPTCMNKKNFEASKIKYKNLMVEYILSKKYWYVLKIFQ